MAADGTPFDLTGKVAVVTGARRGIGRGLALALAAAGADIAAVGRTPPTDLVRDVERLGRRCVPIHADLSDPAQVDRVIPDAVGAFGRVDILVNNAGEIGIRHSALEVTPEEWHGVLQVNLHAVFRLCQDAGPRHDAAGPRQDRQHRVVDERAGRDPDRGLYGQQRRGGTADQAARQ